MKLYFYGCEDEHGSCIYGPSDDCHETRMVAQRKGWRFVEYVYELVNSELIEDYSHTTDES